MNKFPDLNFFKVEVKCQLTKTTKKSIDSLITHYCACEECCGKTDGITASGTIAEAGRTIAVDPQVIPLGTEVEINGHTYIAEDIGGAIQGNRIDIYCNTHEEAIEKGTYECLVEFDTEALTNTTKPD